MLFASVASAESTASLQSQIDAIMAQIRQLQSQLNQAQGNSPASSNSSNSGVPGNSNSSNTSATVSLPTTTGSCHTFNQELGISLQRGPVMADEVAELQRILSTKEGLTISAEEFNGHSNYFGESTAAAVVEFQSKYGIRKTGYVGPITRAKLNALYGCANNVNSRPVITSVSGKAAGNFEIDANSSVGINGKGFLGGGNSKVFIAGVEVQVLQNNDNFIYAKTPANLIPGSVYDLYVVNRNGTSNTVKVKVLSVVSTTNNDDGHTYSNSPTPRITSILPASGPVGTIVEISGTQLAGFEGDLDAWIENDKGESAFLPGMGSTPRSDQTIRVKIFSSLCKSNNSYSGAPCSSYLTITPGNYKIYTKPWGVKSNVVNFTVTAGTDTSDSSLPTVSFTASNGRNTVTSSGPDSNAVLYANVGDDMKYSWNTNGTYGNSSFTVSGSGENCWWFPTAGGSAPWVVKSASGTYPTNPSEVESAKISACQAGHTFKITFTGSNSAGSKSATITVNVNPTTTTVTPVSISDVSVYSDGVKLTAPINLVKGKKYTITWNAQGVSATSGFQIMMQSPSRPDIYGVITRSGQLLPTTRSFDWVATEMPASLGLVFVVENGNTRGYSPEFKIVSDTTTTVVPQTASTSCTDSDGGINIDVAGMADGRVNGLGSYFKDASVGTNGGVCTGTECTSVAEGYCSNGVVSNYLYKCPSGYSVNGACAVKPVTSTTVVSPTVTVTSSKNIKSITPTYGYPGATVTLVLDNPTKVPLLLGDFNFGSYGLVNFKVSGTDTVTFTVPQDAKPGVYPVLWFGLDGDVVNFTVMATPAVSQSSNITQTASALEAARVALEKMLSDLNR